MPPGKGGGKKKKKREKSFLNTPLRSFTTSFTTDKVKIQGFERILEEL